MSKTFLLSIGKNREERLQPQNTCSSLHIYIYIYIGRSKIKNKKNLYMKPVAVF